MTDSTTDAPAEARRLSADERAEGLKGDEGRAKRRRRRRRKGPKKQSDAQTPSVEAIGEEAPLRPPQPREAGPKPRGVGAPGVVAAIDLGTNNCRLLVAAPRKGGFRVVDAFSRIVRLGEGVSLTGRLSDAAMDRTVEALKVCADKINRRGVARSRCIATQACRGAANAEEFVARVKEETGLAFDIISAEEEARLGVRGCSTLLDPSVSGALVFDIGGGSTEVSWLDLGAWGEQEAARGKAPPIASWLSMPLGVVSLHERFGETGFGRSEYEAIVEEVAERVRSVAGVERIRAAFDAGDAHLLGTSGTVTSIAGVHLRLPAYDRSKVDGLWMRADEAQAVCDRLSYMSYDERTQEPCIGTSRAELVNYGCAIYEGVARAYPAERLRIADRGLREGVLAGLFASARRRRGRRGGKRKPAS